MSRLTPLVPAQLDDRQRALYDAITTGPRAGSGIVDEDGALRGPFDPLLRSPTIGDAVQHLGAVIRYEGALRAQLRELAIVVVAVHWQCAFELAVHSRIAESVGVDQLVLEAVRAGRSPMLPEGSAERVVVDVATELLDRRGLSEATFTAAVGVLGEEQTTELVVVIGYYSLLGMVLEGFGITP